jgi:hypothetical protein
MPATATVPLPPPRPTTRPHLSQLDFQDSVGAAVLAICRAVPGGVLMFMPSYALMDKLTRRWQVGRPGLLLATAPAMGPRPCSVDPLNMPRRAMPCRAALRHAAPRYAMPRRAMPCRAALCHAVPFLTASSSLREPFAPQTHRAPAPPQATGLWAQLEALKFVALEPRQAGDAFDKAIAKYSAAVKSGRGGLFLAVCRGKVRGPAPSAAPPTAAAGEDCRWGRWRPH